MVKNKRIEAAFGLLDEVGYSIIAENQRRNKEVVIDNFSRDFSQKPELLNGLTRNVWVSQVYKDEKVQELHYNIKTGGSMPEHTHDYYCVFKVLRGEVFEPVSGRKYGVGEKCLIDKGVLHGVVCMNDTMFIDWNTKSPDIAQRIFERGKY